MPTPAQTAESTTPILVPLSILHHTHSSYTILGPKLRLPLTFFLFSLSDSRLIRLKSLNKLAKTLRNYSSRPKKNLIKGWMTTTRHTKVIMHRLEAGHLLANKCIA